MDCDEPAENTSDGAAVSHHRSRLVKTFIIFLASRHFTTRHHITPPKESGWVSNNQEDNHDNHVSPANSSPLSLHHLIFHFSSQIEANDLLPKCRTSCDVVFYERWIPNPFGGILGLYLKPCSSCGLLLHLHRIICCFTTSVCLVVVKKLDQRLYFVLSQYQNQSPHMCGASETAT